MITIMENSFILVTVCKWPPWFFTNETHRWGPMQQVADSLAQALDFTYSIQVPLDGQWGVRHINGSWSGMVGMIHENVRRSGRTPQLIWIVGDTTLPRWTPVLIL